MDWLRYGAEHYPNRICINEYTYNDIYRGVVRVARKLEPLEATRIYRYRYIQIRYARTQRVATAECTS